LALLEPQRERIEQRGQSCARAACLRLCVERWNSRRLDFTVSLSALKSRLDRRGWAIVVVLAALVLVPAPLLPPEALVDAVEALLGRGRGAAYLVAVIGIHAVFYGALGVAASLAVERARSARHAWLQWLLVPLLVVALAVLIRSLKLGHVPMLENAVVPMGACAVGTLVGSSLRRHGWVSTLVATSVLALALVFLHWPGLAQGPRYRTEALLRRLVGARSTLPAGDARFGRLVQLAFAAPPDSKSVDPVEHNSTALIALGIVMGHERLARYEGLDPDGDLVREAIELREGTTLGGRADWPRHYFVSAALTVVESPFLSDMGGLLKEELDALGKGTGFSFADLAADRAGTRFAQAATASTSAALAMQERLRAEFATADYFPPVADLAENLTVEQFRRDYDGVGSARYRAMLAEIDARLNGCAALRVE
jgi:hypothetical protein